MSSQSSNRDLIINNSSANDLDELFKAVIGPKDSQIPLSVPMRQRNFPASFFKPPDGSISASHSRESSLDASFSPPLSQPSGSPLSPASPQQQSLQQQLNGVPAGLTINHPRAHSSPATLQQTLAVSQAMASAQQSVHLRQFSYDIDHMPLPDGWEESKTPNGERYFINHKDKTTTWEDPRRKLLSQQMQQQLRQHTQPRLVVINQSNTSNSNANTSPNAITKANSGSTGSLSAALGPLPEGWEQSRTPSGEVYFINHVECSTQWWDPRLPLAAQQQTRAQLRNGRTPPPPFAGSTVPSSLVVALQNMNTSGTNSNTEALQQQHQRTVLNLELERQKLRQRQHEILRQNFRPSSLVDDNRLPQLSTTTGIDPFLGGNNGPLNNDCHSRQESADSGLGLGSNYSLPNTPEDFLSIEDTISSSEEHSSGMNRSAPNELGLESLQVGSLDLGTENMESDDLVPSLPEDFNADLLSNVEALLDPNRDNIMTWL